MAQSEPLPLAPRTIRDGALGEVERFTRLVERLPRTDWARPSAAVGWTVGDVVAHLALVLGLSNRLLGTIRGGGGAGPVVQTLGRLSGTVLPAAGPIFDRVNSALPKVMNRVLAPEVVKQQVVAGAHQAQEHLTHLDPASYTRPIYLGARPYPLSFYLAALVNELALHGWDIAATRDGDDAASLSAEACRILPWFYWSGTALMLRLPKRTQGTIQVLLSEPESALWWAVSEGSVDVGRDTARAPAATLRGPSGPYLLTLAGRRDVATSLVAPLNVDGDRVLAEQFLGSWHLI